MKTDFYGKDNRKFNRVSPSIGQDSSWGEQGVCSMNSLPILQNFDEAELRSALKTGSSLVSEDRLRVTIEEKVAQGNYGMAIALLDRLIELYPNNASDYNNRGLIYLRNNQPSQAIADLTYALEINPRLDSAYNNRANCYVAQGDLAAAIVDYDAALDLNPANIRAWINQGITFRDLDMYELAIENFDIALILSKNLQNRIYAERGRAYHLRGDWNCAIADYNRALSMSQANELSNYRQKIKLWLDELLSPLN